MTKSVNTNKKKKISPMAANLQGRLVLMALQCPLVNGGSCGMAKRQSQAKGQRRKDVRAGRAGDGTCGAAV